MNDSGWIYLHRSLFESPNWDISFKCNSFLIYLLRRANWKDSEIYHRQTKERIVIKRGSFISSFKNMAKESRMSIQSVRTCVVHLSKIGFLTYESTSLFSKITIVKYGYWQGGFHEATHESTSLQQASNKPPTHIEELNKDNKSIYTTMSESVKTFDKTSKGNMTEKVNLNADFSGFSLKDQEGGGAAGMPSNGNANGANTARFKVFMEKWNSFAAKHGKPKLTKITNDRLKHFKERDKDPDFMGKMDEILEKIEKNDFLLHGKEQWQGAGWNFLLERQSHYVKILEGFYDKPVKKKVIWHPNDPGYIKAINDDD